MTARSLCFAISMAAFSSTAVQADIVLQVTGPNNWATGPAVNNQSFLAVTWDQAIGYSGVGISFVGHGVSAPAIGTAYLTTALGVGTTISDQIAATTFSAPTGPSTAISLFSGLTLPPNFYYLSIFANPGSAIAWDATSPGTATMTFGGGVSLTPPLSSDGGGYAVLGGSYAPYPPATSAVGFQDDLLIDVTSTPEPAGLSLLMIAVLGTAALRYRRRTRLNIR